MDLYNATKLNENINYPDLLEMKACFTRKPISKVISIVVAKYDDIKIKI